VEGEGKGKEKGRGRKEWRGRLHHGFAGMDAPEKKEYFERSSTIKAQMARYVSRHESLLLDVTNGRMLGKATRGRNGYKCQVTSSARSTRT